MHADGSGLYLQVTSAAAKSWIFRYTRAGRSREMGLGPLTKVPLSTARTAADECRKLLGVGLDPIAERDAEREHRALEAAKAITFGDDVRPDWTPMTGKRGRVAHIVCHEMLGAPRYGLPRANDAACRHLRPACGVGGIAIVCAS
jgi:hypothetical protein